MKTAKRTKTSYLLSKTYVAHIYNSIDAIQDKDAETKKLLSELCEQMNTSIKEEVKKGKYDNNIILARETYSQIRSITQKYSSSLGAVNLARLG